MQPWAGPYLIRITTGASALATWYAHMESVTVSRGQSVTAGTQIGTTGALGNARGCHLHFEVHTQNGPIYGPDNVDPSAWLAAHASTARATPPDAETPAWTYTSTRVRTLGCTPVLLLAP